LIPLQACVGDSAHVPHLKKNLALAAVNGFGNFPPAFNLLRRKNAGCPQVALALL
jgi:hypothetical protein